MADNGVYEGQNRFLRWWPKMLLALAVPILYVGWVHAIQWVSLLVLVAYIHGRWLPWRFTIRSDGLELTFPFGRRIFLPRASLTVRLEMVGAVAMTGRRRHFGYLLFDSIGYDPGGEGRLRDAFTIAGYNLTDRWDD